MSLHSRLLARSLDRAIAAENADPQGLPVDVLADMEADIRANPDKYPALSKALAKIDTYANDTCPRCKGTGGGEYNDCPTCDGNGVI